MSDPFTTLGVPRRFSLDLRELEQRFRDLSRALHPDKHAQASPAERRVAAEKSVAVNDAFRILKNPQTRAAALLAASGRTVEEHTRADPALLAEILELREELDGVRNAPDRDALVATMRARVESHVNEAEKVIAEAFDHDDAPVPAKLDRAYESLVKLRYLYRFLEEADAMLEE
jgi:molecular chaperone HscB